MRRLVPLVLAIVAGALVAPAAAAPPPDGLVVRTDRAGGFEARVRLTARMPVDSIAVSGGRTHAVVVVDREGSEGRDALFLVARKGWDTRRGRSWLAPDTYRIRIFADGPAKFDARLTKSERVLSVRATRRTPGSASFSDARGDRSATGVLAHRTLTNDAYAWTFHGAYVSAPDPAITNFCVSQRGDLGASCDDPVDWFYTNVGSRLFDFEFENRNFTLYSTLRVEARTIDVAEFVTVQAPAWW